MALTDMAFSPAVGLLDTTTYPTEPADETAARTQVQGRMNELRDYLNDTLITEITEGAFNFAASATGTDAYAVSITNVAALTTGLEVFVQADVANTGAATLQVNALTAKAIRKNGTTVLEDGDIPANGIAHLKYDGTNFQLLNPVKTTAVSTHLADTLPHGMAHTQAASGYVKLPDGTIIQWGAIGSTTLATSDKTSINVTFPIAFPTACRFIIGSGEPSASWDGVNIVGSQIASKTAGTIVIRNGSTSQNFTGFYVAVGY